jgi:hypothetical protein
MLDLSYAGRVHLMNVEIDVVVLVVVPSGDHMLGPQRARVFSRLVSATLDAADPRALKCRH